MEQNRGEMQSLHYGIVFNKTLDNSGEPVFDMNSGTIIMTVSYDPTQQALHHISLTRIALSVGFQFHFKGNKYYYIQHLEL